MSAVGGIDEETARRFRAAHEDPRTAELLAQVPASERTGGLGSLAGSLFVLLVVGLLGTVLALVFASTFPPMALLPIAVVGLVFVLAVIALRDQYGAHRTPLVRRLALVESEEAHMRSGPGATPGTTYRITLLGEDGTRSVLRAEGEALGRLRRGDLGVAFQRAERLIAFEPVTA